MPKFNIEVDITDEEALTLGTAVAKGGKTISQALQDMWDGYEGQKGSIRLQVDQWINDELKQ